MSSSLQEQKRSLGPQRLGKTPGRWRRQEAQAEGSAT